MEFNQGSLREETNQQGGEIDFKAAPAAVEKLFLSAAEQYWATRSPTASTLGSNNARQLKAGN